MQIYKLDVHFVKWLGRILFNELSSIFEIILFTHQKPMFFALDKVQQKFPNFQWNT